ncbi:VOC family protein [Streptomyces sp. ODS05-4]|uniref:VOC family protein n=1 Tax=Streptomyces sp. ODS05-4 TaxID=2944939 RepID=UPI00210DDF81|nr:VOC family protein [Streptomyces sp. ODS05-4]
MYQQMIFPNLPVADIEVSKKFFTSLGYTLNEQFSDEHSASVVVSDHIVIMLLEKPKYAEFTTKAIADADTSEVLLALNAESREKVDEMLDRAIAAGAKETRDAQDLGFMYGRAFDDPDGHTFEIFWMDPAAVEGGPEQG